MIVLLVSTTRPRPSELRAIVSFFAPAGGAFGAGRMTESLTEVPVLPKSTVATTELRASCPSIC
ncbi:MAG: hypothetical protein VXY81_14870 [Pseudomonadota bacterium]|nr:hypothetical protein [Pseudomonadota bacterium]